MPSSNRVAATANASAWIPLVQDVSRHDRCHDPGGLVAEIKNAADFPNARSRGVIRDGIDHPTGAAAANPARASVIQTSAIFGSVVNMGPAIAKPNAVPVIKTLCRTTVSLLLCARAGRPGSLQWKIRDGRYQPGDTCIDDGLPRVEFQAGESKSATREAAGKSNSCSRKTQPPGLSLSVASSTSARGATAERSI